MRGESEEMTSVVGTTGRWTLETPSHCPTKLTVKAKKEGRGNLETTTLEFPLPNLPSAIEKTGGFCYPNSVGFCYEAAAVARCLAKSERCCPQYTAQESLMVQQVLETAQEQLGLKAFDDE